MTDSLASKLTIVVTTYNRHDFLLRLLRYYRDNGGMLQVHVLDSSDQRPENPELVALLAAKGIAHVCYPPNISPIEKVHQGLQQVTTPYVVLWADDDLLSLPALQTAVAFLEKNPDFSIAHGVCGFFEDRPSNGGKEIVRFGSYPQRSLLSGSAARRLVDYLSNYSCVYYSVHRTTNLKRNVRTCIEHGLRYRWIELALGCLDVIQGRTKKLGTLYMVRQFHDGQDTWNEGEPIDIFGWIVGPDFAAGYERFRTCLSEELAECDGINTIESREIVKEALWRYVSRRLASGWDIQYQTSIGIRAKLKSVAAEIPGVLDTLARVRAWMAGEPPDISSAALRHRSSKYYLELKPIRDAITRPR